MCFTYCLSFIIMELQGAVKDTPLEEIIADVLKAKWDHEQTKFSLPPLMNLVSILKCTCTLIYLKWFMCTF